MGAVVPSRGFAHTLLHGLLLACAMALAVFLAFGLLGGDDLLRAYPSPERHRGVYELALAESELRWVPTTEGAVGDFDGDGVADQLTVDYLHMEPLFDRATSGMVYVRSGRTGEVLLAHAVDVPMNTAWWCGDRDGNGTDEILVRDNGRRFALGRR